MGSAVLETTGIEILPSGRSLGADVVGIDLNAPLTATQVEQIRTAWAQHLVLRFRGQHALTLEGLAAFSRHFGPLDRRPIASHAMASEYEALPPEITVISNVKVEGKPYGALGDGEAVWHADMTYLEHPPKGACLYAVEVPPMGGNTHFSHMAHAYDTLDAQTKERIKGLSCVHDASRNSAGELRLGYTDTCDPRQTVGAHHPLVATHAPSGRPCLLLGRRRNAYVVGRPLEESEALLNQLWAHATQPALTWTQEWAVGDVLMWDNSCTMHRRDAFDPASRRLMYRTQIASRAAA
jgi:taurine dioxygenase